MNSCDSEDTAIGIPPRSSAPWLWWTKNQKILLWPLVIRQEKGSHRGFKFSTQSKNFTGCYTNWFDLQYLSKDSFIWLSIWRHKFLYAGKLLIRIWGSCGTSKDQEKAGKNQGGHDISYHCHCNGWYASLAEEISGWDIGHQNHCYCKYSQPREKKSKFIQEVYPEASLSAQASINKVFKNLLSKWTPNETQSLPQTQPSPIPSVADEFYMFAATSDDTATPTRHENELASYLSEMFGIISEEKLLDWWSVSSISLLHLCNNCF